MESASSYAEPLRRKQAARVGAAHCFLVATDVLGDLKGRQEAIRQPTGCRPRVL